MVDITRKLATIEKILAVDPIPNADAISVVQIKGWKVVTKKNEFKVGDYVVYIEIDSCLPDLPLFAFLKDRNNPTKPIHLRTVRLRGQISQGIAFSIKDIMDAVGYVKASIWAKDHPEAISGMDTDSIYLQMKEGIDLTELIGITKYDPPLPANLGGEIKGKFPSCCQKTDEERIQNAIDILTKYRDTRFYVSEKMDGTSGTFYLNDGDFGVCGRNYELRDTATNTHWMVARKYEIERKLRQYGKNIAIQGEIIGEGINKNRYGIKGQELRLFSVFFIDTHRYGGLQDLLEVSHALGLPTVPVVDTDYHLPTTVDELLAFASKPSVVNPKITREGVVIRSVDELYDANLGGRLSFKVLSNEYLLKNPE